MNPFFFKNLIFLSFNSSQHLPYKPHFSSFITHHLFSSSSPKKSKLELFNYLVDRHGFSPNTADKASNSKSFMKNPKESDMILSYLKKSGFSMTHLEKIIKYVPSILGSNLENTIKPKIKLFKDMGFTQNDCADIISSNPWILTRSTENQLLPSILLLKTILGTDTSVLKLLKFSAVVLKYDLEKTMIPNIEFMISCGVCKSQLTKLLFNFPRFFVLKPDSIKAVVERLDEMGFDRNSKMFIHAIRTLSSMGEEKWKLKLELFRSLGSSEDEILNIFLRMPQVFAVSERKMRVISDYLLSNGKCDAAYLLAYPGLFIYSLEGRIKPRIHIWEILEKKKLVSRSVTLNSLCKVSDGDFFLKYVLPYENEVGSLFKGSKGLKS